MKMSNTQLKVKELQRAGVIPDCQRKEVLKLAYDPISRNAKYSKNNILTNSEHRQLRQDIDRKDKDAYEQLHARDDVDWDFKYGRISGKRGLRTLPMIPEEDAEKYLESFPDLAEKLFEKLNSVPEERYISEITFNCLAQVHQTEHINLEPRISALKAELKETDANLRYVKQTFQNCLTSTKEIAQSNNSSYTHHNILLLKNSLQSISNDFELFSSILSDRSHRLGMLETQKQIHKMLNVMILHVRITRSNYDHLRLKYDTLKSNLERARQILHDNDIVLDPEQNKGQQSDDEEESELDVASLIAEGATAFSRLCRSLVHRNTKVKRIKSSFSESVKKRQVNCLASLYDKLRRDFYWPWSRELTVQRLTQGLSVLLMITAMFVYLWLFFPSLSVFDGNGCSNRFFFRDIGNLIHNCKKS